jgi:DNA polymerase I
MLENWSQAAANYLSNRGVHLETAAKYGAVVDIDPSSEELEKRLSITFNGDKPEAVLWFESNWSLDVTGYVPSAYMARIFPPVFGGHETKFLNPAGSVLRPYILPSSLELSNRTEIPAIITEGPVRSLLLSQSGLCSISVVGVWNTAAQRSEADKNAGVRLKLHPDLTKWAWSDRVVFLGFDQDYRSNEKVLHALIRNLVLFSSLGAVVKVLQWEPSEGKGLDDFITKRAGLDIDGQKQALATLVSQAVDAVAFLRPAHVDFVFNELGEVEMSGARRKQLAKAWAKKLGTTVEELRAAKKERGPQANAAVVGADPDPWGEAVDLAEVLEQLHTIIKTYVALEDYNVTIAVFWIVFTALWESGHYIPLLIITSPEKACGKSTLRDVIAALVRRPLRAVGLSDGSIHRVIGTLRPTLLIDEAQKLTASEQPNTCVVLNNGFTKGDQIPRYNTETGVMDWFDPACPKLISGIGTFLDEQALSRAFVVEMRRATDEEQSQLIDGAFFDSSSPKILELRRKILRWAIDNTQEYRRLSREIMWEMPESIRGRDKNKFASLFAIAKLAGGGWLELLTKAAFLLLNRTAAHANQSLEHRLLCDCYGVVTSRSELLIPGADNRSFIATQELLQALWALPEVPWNAMPKSGKLLSANQLFFYLKRYKIESRPNPAGTMRGIYVDRILEEYNRYKARNAKGAKETPSDTGEKDFPVNTPENGCQMSDDSSNPLYSNGLSTRHPIRHHPDAPVSDQTGVSDLTPDKVSGVSTGVSHLTPSNVTSYDRYLTSDTEKGRYYRETVSFSASEPFSGLLSEWNRPQDTLTEVNVYFRALLVNPEQWLAIDIETFAPIRWGKNKKPIKTRDALNPWLGEVRLITVADSEQIDQLDLLDSRPDPESIARLSCAGWIAHNAKFELLYLVLHFGVQPAAVFCTRLANAILTNGQLHHVEETEVVQEPRKSKKAKKTSINALGPVLETRLGVHLPKDQGDSYWGGDLSPEQIEYSLNDVRYLDTLAAKQLTTIRAEGLETTLLLETLLLPVIVKAEQHGFAVDRAKIEKRLQEKEKQAAQEKELAINLLGEGCPKLGDNRKEGGLLTWIKDHFGERLPNMEESTLTQWDHPVGKAILDYKHTQKHATTFARLLNYSRLDGRCHAGLNQSGAVTGRFSCADPNLQQLDRTPGLFRDCLIASHPDRSLIVADFKHIELRTGAIFANAVTGLTNLLDVFRSGLDPHLMTAAAVLSKELDQVEKQDRQLAKAVNFGFLYGQQAEGFLKYAKDSYGVSLSLEEAKRFRQEFFARYPDLAGWHKWAWDQVDTATESRTILGRRHLIPPDTNNWNKFQALVNTPACGSAADLIKWSMIELDRALPPDCYLIMCVHDELVVDAPTSKSEEVKQLMERVMAETFAKLFDNIIPGPAEASIGPNWEAAKP